MRTLSVFAALFAAASVNGQAWWTPVPDTVGCSPEMPAKCVWWPAATGGGVPPCECKVTSESCACHDQKAAYSKFYDEALKADKPLVLFVGQPSRKIGDALAVRYDGAELPAGTKSPCVIVGRGCNGETLNRTAVLPGEPSDARIREAIKVQPVCPVFPKPQKASQADFHGLPAMIAAAAIGAMTEQVPCVGPDCSPALFAGRGVGVVPPMQVGTYTGGGGWSSVAADYAVADVYYARTIRGPMRRLFAAWRSARAARMMSFRAVPVQTVPQQMVSAQPTTFTRYEWQPVATYTLEPVTESVPVTRYRWVEKKPETPAMKK